jgi:transposase InsO family protein
VLNMIDDHSRLARASAARRIFTAGDFNAVFTATTSTYGDPASFLSDNGAVFTGAPRRGGRVALEITRHTHGIRFDHSRAYHPQTCGKVDRFHQTLACSARPNAVPTGTPIDTGHYRVRRDCIDNSGVITLRHNSRLHHIGLGRRHAGTPVLARDRHIRVLTTDGGLLRELTLDPSRDYQPQARP